MEIMQQPKVYLLYVNFADPFLFIPSRHQISMYEDHPSCRSCSAALPQSVDEETESIDGRLRRKQHDPEVPVGYIQG